MKVLEQLCIKSWSITAQNGDSWVAKQGQYYTTSKPWPDGTVTVFSNFWFHAPAEIFVPKEE